ncbi:TPA: hypothetical protein ACG3IT_003905, partial [Clostridioides difficile]
SALPAGLMTILAYSRHLRRSKRYLQRRFGGYIGDDWMDGFGAEAENNDDFPHRFFYFLYSRYVQYMYWVQIYQWRIV